jgi:peptidoglycan/LPS O-acetylase OafA/YrhL
MNPQPYLSNLTPLRGIAALLVIVFHADLYLGSGVLIDPAISPIIQKWYLMVDVFFVLSGFIMGYVYLRDFEAKVSLPSYGNFLKARFGRVYPLHLFTFVWFVLVYAVMVWTNKYHADPISTLANNLWALPSHLVLLHGMGLHNFTTWNGPSWSISVEWWMYIVFPVLVPLIVRLSKMGRVALVCLAWAGMWWIVLDLNPNNPLPLPFTIPPMYNLDVTYDFGFLRCFCEFIIGLVVLLMYRDRVGMKLIGSSVFFCLTVCGSLVFMHFDAYDTFTVLTFALIIWSAAYNTTGVSRVLTLGPLQRLGDLSYSIYLTHFPVFVTIASALQFFPAGPMGRPSTLVAWIICFVWILITLGVSAITYRFIEVPARSWVKSIGKGRSAQSFVDPMLVR